VEVGITHGTLIGDRAVGLFLRPEKHHGR